MSNYHMTEQNSLCYRSLRQLKDSRDPYKDGFIKFSHNSRQRSFRIINESPDHLLLESEIGEQHRIVQRKDPRTKS